MADQSLQDAINSAAEEITGKPLSEITEEKPNEETPEEEGEEGEAEVEGEELNEEQSKEAKNLYKLLADPKKGPALIAALAQQHGLLNKPVETKKEEQALKKSIADIFKEELGDQYGFLADRLSKAVDKSLDTVRAEQTQAVRDLQVANLTRDVNSTLASLAKETNGASRGLESRMSELMNEYPIGQKTDVDKYIRDMYKLASAGKATSNVQKGTADKIRRQANDVSNRLPNGSGNPGVTSLPNGKNMSLKESVNWAVKQMEKGNKK